MIRILPHSEMKHSSGCKIPVIKTELNAMAKNDKCSRSQRYEAITPAKNNSITKSQCLFKILKNEPKVKILCHIAAKDKEDENLSSLCSKEITPPIREKLMRQAMHNNPC